MYSCTIKLSSCAVATNLSPLSASSLRASAPCAASPAHRVAMCCDVLQWVAVSCNCAASPTHRVAVCCAVLQWAAVSCSCAASPTHRVAVCCGVWQCIAVSRSCGASATHCGISDKWTASPTNRLGARARLVGYAAISPQSEIYYIKWL